MRFLRNEKEKVSRKDIISISYSLLYRIIRIMRADISNFNKNQNLTAKVFGLGVIELCNFLPIINSHNAVTST